MPEKAVTPENHVSSDVIIVGGSLAGLTFALACADRGIHTRVLERVNRWHRGGALGVDRALLMRVVATGLRASGNIAPFPIITRYRRAVSWQALHDWLRKQALQSPEITLTENLSISEVVQCAACATAITMKNERMNAAIIVGADGYKSVVRRAINSEHPDCSYADYLLWRGLVPEAELARDTRWARSNNGVALVTKTGYRLIAYPVAGPDGSLEPGQRLISFAWYDGRRTSLLRELHCLSSTGIVLSSLASENVPEKVRQELWDLAQRIWPEPWRTAILHALEHRQVFATPVAEYFPERLHRGRLAIIGDAAHVVSPATGMGFVAGILDAETLADALARNFGQTADTFPHALEDYGRRRLPAAQQLATRSMDWSRVFLSRAKTPRRVERHRLAKNKT